LLKRIGRERVEFTDTNPPAETGAEPQSETATYSRIERLVRVLWTMALHGNLAAMRCVLEYLVGKPARIEPGGPNRGDGLPAADDMAQLCLFGDEDEG
jgi:hypothetical protein